MESRNTNRLILKKCVNVDCKYWNKMSYIVTSISNYYIAVTLQNFQSLYLKLLVLGTHDFFFCEPFFFYIYYG